MNTTQEALASRRPNGSPPIPTRTVRIPDEVWRGAMKKARGEGKTMTAVINEYLRAYIAGEKR